MICPKCKNHGTRVLDSRETNEKREIRRRRKCEKCDFRFTTFERVEATNFIVVKKDNSRESYNRQKLEKGIWKACEKRPVTQDQVSGMINKLEEKWSASGKEIKADTIGEDLMDALKRLDEVAYIRFASVYRHFKDIESFKKELQNLLG
ncbi:transcriptional repressor NrdR [Candidatus Peregrinibacteria bacterium]|nr:transcriptional repressor NrdR [Candidatus Peregrinibacteria bacterium]